MNSAGQSGDRKSYRVILLLVVGLTAFSSAMKELNVLREFSRDTSNLVASWSKAVAPVVREAPAVVVPAEVPPVVEETEICDNGHTLSAVEPVDRLQLGGSVAETEVKSKEVGKPVVAGRSTRRDAQAIASLRSHRPAGIDIVELRKQVRRGTDLKVMILADSDGEAEFVVPSNFEFKLPKAKSFRHVTIKPEDREILKNLNRAFNLRSAG